MSRWITQPRMRGKRTAYTLLELMLALALLGTLMTVAWSLMGTFGDAQKRGWKLSHRTQTIRAARQWLQDDMQHLLRSDVGLSSTAPLKSRLTGNLLGFTAAIAPSLDPLPFFEQLMASPSNGSHGFEGLNGLNGIANEEPIASLTSDTDADAMVAQAQQSLWPPESMEVEYRLAPMDGNSTASTDLLGSPADLRDVQFSLTRRELLDASAIQNQAQRNRGGVAEGLSQANSSQSNRLQANPSDRVLTAQDLYRQTDEAVSSDGVAIRETRLDGLTHVQFRYFDGQNWASQWNSDQRGGLPVAIALSFDFPSRSDMNPPDAKSHSDGANRDDTGESQELLDDKPVKSELLFADAALAAEPSAETLAGAELGIVESATHQIQIVVYVGGAGGSSGTKRLFGSERSPRSPRGFE